MKKFVIVMVSLVAVLMAFAGCGNRTNEPSVSEPATGIDLATGEPGTVEGKVNGPWEPSEDFLAKSPDNARETADSMKPIVPPMPDPDVPSPNKPSKTAEYNSTGESLEDLARETVITPKDPSPNITPETFVNVDPMDEFRPAEGQGAVDNRPSDEPTETYPGIFHEELGRKEPYLNPVTGDWERTEQDYLQMEMDLARVNQPGYDRIEREAVLAHYADY